MLVPGLAIWLWSVILILANVPRGRLITGGPYGWVKHPLYAAVALLVLPWAGFRLDTWLCARAIAPVSACEGHRATTLVASPLAVPSIRREADFRLPGVGPNGPSDVSALGGR